MGDPRVTRLAVLVVFDEKHAQSGDFVGYFFGTADFGRARKSGQKGHFLTTFCTPPGPALGGSLANPRSL